MCVRNIGIFAPQLAAGVGSCGASFVMGPHFCEEHRAAHYYSQLSKKLEEMRVILEVPESAKGIVLSFLEMLKTIQVKGVTLEEEKDETILRNQIFNGRLFDTNEKLLKLRRVIAHSIDMGEYNAMFGEPNPSTIDPDVQGEWYYLMKALEESEVARKFSVPSFIDQMIDWYPWLFSFETPKDMQAFKRKMEKSISHEKSIWKYGKAKEVTKLKDMWARYNQTNIDYAKVERIFNAAYTGLCVKLVALKQEIAKEKATR
jgi:hypothetical protein